MRGEESIASSNASNSATVTVRSSKVNTGSNAADMSFCESTEKDGGTTNGDESSGDYEKPFPHSSPGRQSCINALVIRDIRVIRGTAPGSGVESSERTADAVHGGDHILRGMPTHPLLANGDGITGRVNRPVIRIALTMKGQAARAARCPERQGAGAIKRYEWDVEGIGEMHGASVHAHHCGQSRQLASPGGQVRAEDHVLGIETERGDGGVHLTRAGESAHDPSVLLEQADRGAPGIPSPEFPEPGRKWNQADGRTIG